MAADHSSGDYRVGLFEGTEPSLSRETQQLLRARLRMFSLLIVVAMSLFLARDLLGLNPVGGAYDAGGLALVVAAQAALAFLLFSSISLSMRQLRTIEAAALGIEVAWIARESYKITELWAQQGNSEFVVGQIDSAALPYFSIIVAYGALIPSEWRRTVIAGLLLSIPPFAVFIAFPLISEAGAGFRISTAEWFTLAIELGLAVIIASTCTHIIYTLRRVEFEARQLGQYRLTDRIGSGGMGEVWRAEHRFLARPAAIKLIRPEVVAHATAPQSGALHGLLRRFEREAQATASLSSPHTIRLYDFGISADGAFYYVMELLDGLDLEHLVKQYGPLPPARVVHLLRQACDSLAEAHDAGMIHRDVKPGNMYVCRIGRRWDFIKLLDFGLVIGAEGFADADTRLTTEGTITGTPAYMSPEAVVQARELDAQSDIYSLGCVAYWLLTGNLVFDADNPVAMALAHAKDAPPPPSERTELAIPSSIERIVLACLAKDPADRPNTDELAALLDACDVDAWTQQEAREWWELRRAGA